MGLNGSKPPKFEQIHQHDDKGGGKSLKVIPESKGGNKKSMDSLSKISFKTSSSFTMVFNILALDSCNYTMNLSYTIRPLNLRF